MGLSRSSLRAPITNFDFQDFGSHVQDFGSLDWGFEFDSDNYVEGSELSWRPWESSFWAQKGLFGVLGVQGKSSNRLLELSSLL